MKSLIKIICFSFLYGFNYLILRDSILYGEINKEIAVSIFSVLSYFLIKTIVEKWK